MDGSDAIARRLRAVHDEDRFCVARFDELGPLGVRVAVLPSAFNPPTRAHFALLHVAGPDATPAALLTTRNVDKGIDGARLSDRVGMLLAAAPDEGYAVLASNAARLADQGEALRGEFPGTAFDFIVGYDTLIRLFDTKYYTDMARELDEFFAHHRVIAANRGDATLDVVHEFLEQPLVRDYRAAIEPVELHEEPARLSSTQARGEFSERQLSPVVHPRVARYIREHGLYGSRAD
jgi:nicotinic acid mononucleotide adenylyltransferase